jgi:DNA-binding transcriptional LysR family regulator
LTGDGERLLAECRGIVNAADSLRERAKLLRRPDAGVLRIAATPQMIDGVFSGFLHRYVARFPAVEIKLTEGVGTEPFTKLERGELDLVINYLQVMQLESHEFDSFPLPPLEFLAVSHPSLPLGSGRDIEIGRLTEFPMLLLDPSYGVRTTFDAACRLAGTKPRVFIESRSPHTLLSMAEAGHGVAIVPSVLPTHRYRVRIARVTYRRKPLRGLLTVLWDRRRILPPYAKEFCSFLDTYMREVFPISQATTSQPRRHAAPVGKPAKRVSAAPRTRPAAAGFGTSRSEPAGSASLKKR